MNHKQEIDVVEAYPQGQSVEVKPEDVYTNSIKQSQIHAAKTPDEKRLLLKLDVVIVPLAALSFLVAYLDRNSIGNARIMGLQKDLHLSPEEFFNCITIFFVGIICLILPANLLGRRLKPNRLLGTAIVIWGIILCIMSRVETYAEVMVLRLLLGFGQAFVQTLSIYTSLWYKRDEIASRSAVYYSCATTSGAFGGLIAYGIDVNLGSSTAFRPWGWLFLIEGLLAVAVGCAVWLVLPRYPDDLRNRGKDHWLFTEQQIELAARRFEQFNDHAVGFRPKQLLATVIDPKSWLFAVAQGAGLMGVSNLGSFLPTFINNFGLSIVRAQLFTIIPYACAFFSVLICGILSDRWNTKAPFLVAVYTLTCFGYVILLSTPNAVAGVIASCCVTTGCYVAVLLLPVWAIINTCGFTKRATTWALCELFALVFSIMGSRIYNTPPRFFKGHSVVLGLNFIAILCVIAAWWWLRKENARKDRAEQEYADRGELHPHRHLSLENVCDQHISFRYII